MTSGIFGLLAALLLAAPALAGPPPVRVMIVGDFHMANPGRDLHNQVVDDMLAPRRQGQIAAVTNALARFHPTLVAAEWPADVARSRYAQYLDGSLKPSPNEVVQLAFRLAKTAGLKTVYGIDADGDFPFDAVQAYAQSHDQTQILTQAGAGVDEMLRGADRAMAEGGVAAELRYMNDPKTILAGAGFYRTMLRIGSGSAQPGADLLAAWYRRNFLICANLIKAARSGDRVVVFFGSGHALLLRQCVQETPGFELVEPNAFLPK